MLRWSLGLLGEEEGVRCEGSQGLRSFVGCQKATAVTQPGSDCPWGRSLWGNGPSSAYSGNGVQRPRVPPWAKRKPLSPSLQGGDRSCHTVRGATWKMARKTRRPDPRVHTEVTQPRDTKGTVWPVLLGGILSSGYSVVPGPKMLNFFCFFITFSLHCPMQFFFPFDLKIQRNRNSIGIF